MNEKSKSPFSSIIVKVVAAVALVAVALVILSGLVLNVDDDIKVIGKPIGVTGPQSFASLPEYGYIQNHVAKNVQAGKNIPVTGFQALPEYGYIMSHYFANGQTMAASLPSGLRSLSVAGYIQAHNQLDFSGNTVALSAPLPAGLRAMPVSGYIEFAQPQEC